MDVGFLEMTDPPAGAVADRLVARRCRRIVVLPLMLLGAGHAKSDVPAVVVEARRRHPGVEWVFGQPPRGGRGSRSSCSARRWSLPAGPGCRCCSWRGGTSDPDANGDAHKAARLVAEWTGAPFVHVGFSGVTRPAVLEAADVFARLGYTRVAVAWWYLTHGRLIERGRGELESFAAGKCNRGD